ncbi:hypothetical protein ACJX0J_016314 [Zea mays]
MRSYSFLVAFAKRWMTGPNDPIDLKKNKTMDLEPRQNAELMACKLFWTAAGAAGIIESVTTFIKRVALVYWHERIRYDQICWLSGQCARQDYMPFLPSSTDISEILKHLGGKQLSKEDISELKEFHFIKEHRIPEAGEGHHSFAIFSFIIALVLLVNALLG